MINQEVYTVITGASKGLGKCLAEDCAGRGRNLILIALPNESVSQTAKYLSNKYKVKALSYETNLKYEENLESLTKWINTNYKIDMLINNAGIGGTNHFGEVKTDYLDTILQLNMKALVLLTHKLLPLLKTQTESYILNIASLAAFGPMPYKTVYPASKAFVSSFSRGLNAELKGSNVSVSVAYPGGMATTPEIIERMNNYSSFVKSTFLSPEKTAEICIRKTLARKTIIVPGLANKLSRFFIAFIPEEIRFTIFRKNLIKEIPIKTA
ncbi:MAG: SDR family NAD(P)-dependent oxidoreductase [Bacteroidales bacterium]|jgi:short-subunit dehydrogenase|nr:SDR family NAD(P)-dependent oxidoreductase [Bacteroidales bacterium]